METHIASTGCVKGWRIGCFGYRVTAANKPLTRAYFRSSLGAHFSQVFSLRSALNLFANANFSRQ